MYFTIFGQLIDVKWLQNSAPNKPIALGRIEILGSTETLNLIFFADPEDNYESLLFVGSQIKAHLELEHDNLPGTDELAFIVKKVEQL